MSRPVTIEVRGLRVMARIGVSDAELEVERALVVDVEVRDPDNAATATDALEDTADYSELAAEAERLARAEPHRTLERLAARIADRLAEIAGEGAALTVRVAKPDPPMAGAVEGVAVTVRGGPDELDESSLPGNLRQSWPDRA